MAKTTYTNIDAYHASFQEEVQERMQTIRGIVHKIAPDAEEVISYSIPAFKIGKHFLIYYSAYAKHISLSSPWSSALLAKFEVELTAYKVSKSAIQLPLDKDLPVKFIEQIVKFRKQEVAAAK